MGKVKALVQYEGLHINTRPSVSDLEQRREDALIWLNALCTVGAGFALIEAVRLLLMATGRL